MYCNHYAPYNMEQVNFAESSYVPSTINKYNNKAFIFWQRHLFQRACSTIELGVPEEWEGNVKDFLMYSLLRGGYVAVSENDKFGQFFQYGTLGGRNFYYQPTKVLISNPAYSATLYIGKNCELLRLTPDYTGIWDIISYYAEKLATMDPAINISITNNKYAFFMGARNKAAAETFKKGMDLVNAGEPMMVFDKKLIDDPTDQKEPWQFWSRDDMVGSYVLDKLLRDFQTILNQFDCEIGIPTVPYQKAERMVTSEADSKELDATSKCQVWVDTLQSSIKKIKKLYPDIKLSAEMRFNPLDQKEGEEIGKDNTSSIE